MDVSRVAISTAPDPLGVSGRVNVPYWAKLTHDTIRKRGSVVSLSFIFTNPSEDKKNKKKTYILQ